MRAAGRAPTRSGRRRLHAVPSLAGSGGLASTRLAGRGALAGARRATQGRPGYATEARVDLGHINIGLDRDGLVDHSMPEERSGELAILNNGYSMATRAGLHFLCP